MTIRTLDWRRLGDHAGRRPISVDAPAPGAPGQLVAHQNRPNAARRLLSIALADDRPLRRAAVAAWLAADASIEVIAGVARAEDAAAVVVDARPSVFLLACDAPMHPFVSLASRIPRLSERTRVILLSDRHDPRTCRAACSCAALAHVCLDDSPEDLQSAIRGNAPPGMPRCVRLDEGPEAPPALSNREREVLVHLARGLSAKQTAAALGICPKTVDNHAQRLMRKLGLHSRAEVVRFAVREGYVAP